jgi:hypothetical protein
MAQLNVYSPTLLGGGSQFWQKCKASHVPSFAVYAWQVSSVTPSRSGTSRM